MQILKQALALWLPMQAPSFDTWLGCNETLQSKRYKDSWHATKCASYWSKRYEHSQHVLFSKN